MRLDVPVRRLRPPLLLLLLAALLLAVLAGSACGGDDGARLDALEQRVLELERENAALRGSAPGVLRVRGIEVVDEEGRPRVELAAEGIMSRVTLRDPQGRAVATLADVDGVAPHLFLDAPDRGARVHLSGDLALLSMESARGCRRMGAQYESVVDC
jgi:hypothetical protein